MRHLFLLAVACSACGSSDADPVDTDGARSDSDAVADDAVNAPVTSCPIPEGATTCAFEGSCGVPETCCGITAPGTGHVCSGGKVYYVIDDTCHFASCSPGCGVNEYTTSAGCTPCAEIDAFVRQRLEAAADAQGGCEVDADCVATNTAVGCGNYCDLAVRADGLEAYLAAAAAIDVADCSFDGTRCIPDRQCDLSGDVRCVEGACRELPACAAERHQHGDPCNDGSACTTGDSCVEERCVGQAIPCEDDDNACTTDTCDPVTGCTFTPNAQACTASNTCSVGAQCADGACVTSPAAGFDRAFAEPFRVAAAIAVGADTTYIAGWDVQEPLAEVYTGLVMTLDSTGVITRRLDFRRLSAITDVVAVQDGVVVVGHGGSATSNVSLLRLDAAGNDVWRRDLDTGGDDWGASLARSGTRLGVVWYASSEPHDSYDSYIAITDLDGREPTLTRLGKTRVASATFDGAMSIAEDGTGFVVALDRDGGNPAVAIVRVAADGTLTSDAELAQPSHDEARGVLALPGGDALVWGHSAGTPWLRRVTTQGPTAQVTWTLPLRIEAATLRDGAIDVLASEGSFDSYSGPADVGSSWLSRIDLDGHEGPRVVMPRGYAIVDAAPIDHGFAVVGNIASELGYYTADSQIWLRRAATSPACP